MPSVSYGNTLTDLGRNIAEQKASEQALAGILAQVGAQKLAALNALAANRGRTQAERDVGMDRNATTRQVAMLESALRAQELADRDRQASAGLTAAQELARIQGGFQKDVAAMPYSPEALKQLEALARLNAQTLNPRVQETMFTENAERERQNIKAKQIAADANRRASLAFQEFQRRSGSWTPFTSDRSIAAEYNSVLDGIIKMYGDDASLIRPVTRPGGKVEFEPMVLPQIMPSVPQLTGTGTTNAVPVAPVVPPPPAPAATVPNARGIPLMSRPMAPITAPSFSVPISQSNMPASTVIDAANADRIRQQARAFGEELLAAGVPESEIQARVFLAFPAARGLF